MTNFKLGDWARVTEGHAKNNIFKVTGLLGTDILLGNCFNYKADHCKLWAPEEGEWCWFWNDETDIPRLRQFLYPSNIFDRPTVYITQPDPATVMSRTYWGIESYKYCEPFIGQLPTILKDNK